MAIDEKLLKSVIAEVLKEMNTADTSAASAVEGETYECPGMQITEIGDAEKGTNPNEVVLGLAPAFGEDVYKRQDLTLTSSKTRSQMQHLVTVVLAVLQLVSLILLQHLDIQLTVAESVTVMVCSNRKLRTVIR